MKTIEKIKKAYGNVIMTKGEALKLSKRIIIAEIEIEEDEFETKLLVSAIEKITIYRHQSRHHR